MLLKRAGAQAQPRADLALQRTRVPASATQPAFGGGRARLVINGRFLTQSLTGVQRYAREVVAAIDALLAGDRELDSAWEVELHHPPGAAGVGPLRRIAVRQVGVRGGHAWDQIDLLRSSRGAALLCLGNTGPVLHPRMAVVFHDMGVFAHGEAYSLAYRTLYRQVHRMVGRRARRILTVSEFSAAEIALHCGVERTRITVAPNAAEHLSRVPADPGVLRRLGLDPGAYVLAVGSRNPLKDVATAVAAVRRLGGSTGLVVVGERSGAIFNGAAEADEPFVLRTGPVSDGELRSLYRGALCLAFPSRYEGFGIPPLEAMSEGCPVVVARSSALPEVCGAAALYFNPGDAAGLASCIAALRERPELRERLAREGAERARRFRWELTARRVMEQLGGMAAA